MPIRGLSVDRAGPGIESGVERQRAVADVLESVALSPAWGERQDRILAVECFDCGLLVHAEDRRVC